MDNNEQPIVTGVAPHPHKRILIGWFTGAASTIFLPLLIFTISRVTNSEQQEENNGDNKNNNENDNNSTPWWFFGNSDRRDEERTPPILIATYLWSVLVFSGLVYYGYHHLNRSMDYNEIVVALVLFANYSILSMFLFSGVEGAIETEGPGVEEHGFVGQFGVMMYMTSAFWLIYSVVFSFVFRHLEKKQNVTKLVVSSEDYQIHSPDQVAV